MRAPAADFSPTEPHPGNRTSARSAVIANHRNRTFRPAECAHSPPRPHRATSNRPNQVPGRVTPGTMLGIPHRINRGGRMLEVIDKGSATESHPVPLVFVHGGAHGAWCWDDHFLDFFANNGYRAIALSLRGHGGSPVSKPLNKCTIADYVDDVRSVAATLPA